MSIYDELTQKNLLPKGDHVAMIEDVEMKVSKSSGKEYLTLKLKLRSGELLFHNFYFSSGALPMTVKQLKNLKILSSLPIYDSVKSLESDINNFIRKTMELLMALQKKKITIKVTGYDDNDRPKTWVQAYSDIENAAIQKEIPKSALASQKTIVAQSDSDEIPF